MRVLRGWVAAHLVATCCFLTATKANNNEHQIGVWQSGPESGPLDAGGMVYDPGNEELLLVGTAYGTNNVANCFVARVPLNENKGATLLLPLSSALHRCDLMAALQLGSVTIVAGTESQRVNELGQADGFEPILHPLSWEQDEDGAEVPASSARSFAALRRPTISYPFRPLTPPSTLFFPIHYTYPTALTANEKNELYMASIHRVHVVARDQIGSANADIKIQIMFQISKFLVTDNITHPLEEEWSIVHPTTLFEEKPDTISALELSLFDWVPHTNHTETEAPGIGVGVAQARQAATEVYSYDYRYDGALITGLEYVPTSADQSVLLIAGSAPGTPEDLHPFKTESQLGVWDGYISKLSSDTGDMVWNNYQVSSQPNRSDFYSFYLPSPRGLSFGCLCSWFQPKEQRE